MRTYISDIYNVKTNKRFKYINPKSISPEYYCVELRDTVTDEQIALCRPDEVLEDKYRCSFGVVSQDGSLVLNSLYSTLEMVFDVDDYDYLNKLIIKHHILNQRK